VRYIPGLRLHQAITFQIDQVGSLKQLGLQEISILNPAIGLLRVIINRGLPMITIAAHRGRMAQHRIIPVHAETTSEAIHPRWSPVRATEVIISLHVPEEIIRLRLIHVPALISADLNQVGLTWMLQDLLTVEVVIRPLPGVVQE
jgi:hypothetical protein